MQDLFNDQLIGTFISQVASSPMVTPTNYSHIAVQGGMQNSSLNLTFTNQASLNMLSNFANQQHSQQQLRNDVNRAIGGLVNQNIPNVSQQQQQQQQQSSNSGFVTAASSFSHSLINNNSNSNNQTNTAASRPQPTTESIAQQQQQLQSGQNFHTSNGGGGHTNRQANFPCLLCHRSYTYRHGLTQHMLTHLAHKPYTCSECGKDFCRKFQLDRHMKVHYKVNQSYQCTDCSEVFHMRESFLLHMRSHSHPEENPFHCDACPSVFTSKTALVQHRRKEHPGQSLNRLNVHDAIVNGTGTGGGGNAVGGGGGGTTSVVGGGGGGSLHVVTNAPVENDPYQRNLYQTPSGYVFAGPYPCFLCGKRYLDRYGLKRHFRSHSGERPHECDICGLTFMEISHLKQHRFTHSGETPYHCIVCARGFNRKYSYQRHLRWHAKSTLAPAALSAELQQALGLLPSSSSSADVTIDSVVNSLSSINNNNYSSIPSNSLVSSATQTAM